MPSFLTKNLPRMLSLAFKGERHILNAFDYFENQLPGNGETFLVLLESLASFGKSLGSANFEYWVEAGQLLQMEVDQARANLADRLEVATP